MKLDEGIAEYYVYSTSRYKFLKKVDIDEYLNINTAYFTNDVHDAIKFRSPNAAKGIAQMLMENSNCEYEVVRARIEFSVLLS